MSAEEPPASASRHRQAMNHEQATRALSPGPGRNGGNIVRRRSSAAYIGLAQLKSGDNETRQSITLSHDVQLYLDLYMNNTENPIIVVTLDRFTITID